MTACREGEGIAVRWCETHARPMFGDATTCTPSQPVPSGLDVEPGHNHTTGGYPTFPVFREACPLGCDALRAGEIAANTGKRPNLTVVDPFVEVAAMQAVQAARLAHPVEGPTESGEER